MREESHAHTVHRRSQVLDRAQAALHGAMAAMLVGAFLADFAYARTYQVQWNNFAAWLNIAGLGLTTIGLVCAIVDLCRPERRRRQQIAVLVVMLATWLVAGVDALTHSRDAFGSMPDACGLSMVAAVFALVAVWLGISGLRQQEAP